MVNVMEKVVMVPQKVEDLGGLFMDLKRASFHVRNVGADVRGTYVYLGLEEEKDPVPIVESWVGRRPPLPSDEVAFKARVEEYRAMVVATPKPAEEIPASAEASPSPAPAPAALPVPAAAPAPEAPKRFAFFRRILGMK